MKQAKELRESERSSGEEKKNEYTKKEEGGKKIRKKKKYSRKGENQGLAIICEDVRR